MQDSYHLIQVLTNQGCFRAFLHSHGRACSAVFLWCPNEREEVEDTIFRCFRYSANREELGRKLGRLPKLEDTALILCGDIRLGRIESTVFQAMLERKEEAASYSLNAATKAYSKLNYCLFFFLGTLLTTSPVI